MSIKITYTAEDGTTFTSRNEALIHDAIKETGTYLESYKMKELTRELDKLIIVQSRVEELLRPDKTPIDIAVRSGVGVHKKEDYFDRNFDSIPSTLTKNGLCNPDTLIEKI